MSAEGFLLFTADVTLAALSIALLLVVYRLIKGPTLPDRIVALDLLVGVVIGFIGTFGIKTGFYHYLDVALGLGLVGFLATIAFARFILTRGTSGDAPNTLSDSDSDSEAQRP